MAQADDRTGEERWAPKEGALGVGRYRDDFLPQDDRGALRELAGVDHEDDLRRDIEEFGRLVMGHLEALRRECETARENQGFTERQERNERRANARLEVRTLPNGDVVAEEEDGHAELGITNGWTRQANKTISAYLYQALFARQQRPYSARARGAREDRSMRKAAQRQNPAEAR